MKTKIGVLESCFKRCIQFHVCPKYKDFFEVNISAQRTRLTSIIQKSMVGMKNIIGILPLNKLNKLGIILYVIFK